MRPEKKIKPETEDLKSAGAGEFLPGTSSGESDSLSVQVDDKVERQYFRRTLFLIGGTFLVMLMFFTGAFFLVVRGAERTVIPEIVDEELADAIILLQERELYPRLQMKYTGDPSDKGRVLSQDPEPGLYVKAGRRVTLTVSRGAIVDNVEEYVGMSITETRGRLTSLFSTFKPLLIIREPITYVYDDSEAGTILSQTPEAGTPLGDPQEMILVVSRGILDRPIVLPDLSDYSADNAMRVMARMAVPFLFTEDNVDPVGYVARISGQSPSGEAEIALGEKATLKFSRPEAWPEDSAFGLFNYTMPEYPVPVLLEVIIREPGADDRNLFSMPHPGGRLSFPYVLPIGSDVLVSANGEEILRHDVLIED